MVKVKYLYWKKFDKTYVKGFFYGLSIVLDDEEEQSDAPLYAEMDLSALLFSCVSHLYKESAAFA